MRIVATALFLTLLAPAVASAQVGPAPAQETGAGGFSTETQLGTLVDNAATKAVLAKHLPGIADSPQLDQARGLSLEALAQFIPDQLTPDKLKAINADLAAIK